MSVLAIQWFADKKKKYQTNKLNNKYTNWVNKYEIHLEHLYNLSTLDCGFDEFASFIYRWS